MSRTEPDSAGENSGHAERHAVVTGASSGIGRAIVDRLLAEKWAVTGLSRSRGAHSQLGFRWVPVDLADPDAICSAAASIGHVDAIVHAAGFQRSAPLGELSRADGEAMWRVHVEAASLLVNALVHEVRPEGRIVLIGSRTMDGAAGKSQYAATKAALLGLARSWAMELAPRRITVNVVAPGPTDTPMLQDPGRAATPPRLPPLGRFVRPDEVAELTAFLLGHAGAMITGQCLVMCGGASL